MKYVLIKTYFNWADEIDFPGWEVMSKGDFEDYKKEIKEYWEKGGDEFDIYVGTNEEINFSSAEDCEPSSVEEITESDFDTVNRLFGGSSGEITFSSIVEYIR